MYRSFKKNKKKKNKDLLSSGFYTAWGEWTLWVDGRWNELNISQAAAAPSL